MKIMKSIIYVLLISIFFMAGLLVGTLSAAIPSVTSPTPDTTLSGSTTTFDWADNGTIVESWCFRAGTTVGSSDIYKYCGSETSTTVSGIPTDGSTIYVRLWYMVSGTWLYVDYQYLASSGSQQSGCPCFNTDEINEILVTSYGALLTCHDGRYTGNYLGSETKIVYEEDDYGVKYGVAGFEIPHGTYIGCMSQERGSGEWETVSQHDITQETYWECRRELIKSWLWTDCLSRGGIDTQ